MGATFFGTQCT